MINTATVISTSAGLAVVAVERVPECSSCGSRSGCPGCSQCSGAVKSEALNQIGARPGDRVEIYTSGSRIALLLVAAFIAPIAIPVAGYAVTAHYFGSTAGYIAMAVLFAASLCALVALDHIFLRGKVSARIVRIVAAPEDVNNFKESGI